MSRSTTYLIIFLFIFLPVQILAQSKVDSLLILTKNASETRKGELNLEIAHHLLSENPESSIEYAENAQIIGAKTNNHYIIIRSYHIIGEAYQKQNKMKEAIASYLKGLDLAEKFNQKSLAGSIYNGIGVCYFQLNDPKKAEYYLKLAAQAKRDANDYQYYAFISANLAALKIMNKSFDEAITVLKEVEKTLLSQKQDKYLATIYNSLGAAYQSIQSNLALTYYEKSLELASKNKDYLSMMTSSQNIGDYYFEQKKYSQAIEFMKKAIATNELRPEDQYKPMLFARLSELYNAMQDFKNAYHYKKLETEANQRLFSVQKQKEIDELEIKYESERKEKEIQLSRQEIERTKNQRNILVFATISLFLVAGFITYLIFQRKKITQKFEKEKLRLFENIFHEIRTPLTLIDGPIQVMKQQSDASQQEQLALMERSSTKLIHLVNELLDASKLGKGSYQLSYITGSLDVFIENIINQFESEAQSKMIKLIHTKNNADHYYSFPSNALEKIITNLVGNAIKYCPPHSEIWINSQIKENSLFVEVRDNGPGIPKKEQKKVFQRFFRGNTTSNVSGTGIGLSLVKELVELTQGTIALKSEGNGATFLVTIPIQETNQQLDTAAVNTAVPVLLLAEDDADMAAFTISILKNNFQIIHAKNGAEALKLIRENLPDIVLSDIMMPEKDGIELLTYIRTNELTNHLPVVLFSAKSSLGSRLQGLQQGAEAYIAKPFSPEELKLTVQNLFNTIIRNKELYKKSIQSDKKFEERIKSGNAYVNKVIEKIIKNIDNNGYSVNELSEDMAVSRSQLHRKLVALTGFSTTHFISMIRLEKAKDLLIQNEGNITEIAYQCGFSSQSYFTKNFTEYFGKSPSQMIKNQ